jgi:hypothetical protein
MNNAVFGKTMENVKKRVNVELVNSVERYEKLARDPMYVRRVHFCDDEAGGNVLVGVLRQRKAITLDKPMAVGFTVLELSKLTMYEYHYCHMMEVYGPERAQLCYTDTDSLLYEIQTDNIYDDMAQQLHRYDTSDYPKDHSLYSLTNKKVLGKMKDEASGVPIVEFVGLKAKMYAVLASGGKEIKKKAKGVSKYVVKKDIHHKDYCNVLDNSVIMNHSMNMFRTVNHDVYAITLVKTSLSAYDDKRWIQSDGINSYAYGHCDIVLENIMC